MRWYDLPQDGAQDMEVRGVEEDGVKWTSDIGEGLRVMICLSAYHLKVARGEADLDDWTCPSKHCEYAPPPALFAPAQTPSSGR
jgi:hypothetical protein